MEQQRKSVNNNLKKITEKLTDSLRSNIEEIEPELASLVEKLKNNLQSYARQASEISAMIGQSESAIIELSNKIKLEGNI